MGGRAVSARLSIHTMSCCRLSFFVATRCCHRCRLVLLLSFAAFEMICNKSVCHCPLATPHWQITCHFSSCPSWLLPLLGLLILPSLDELALSLPLSRNCLLFTLVSSPSTVPHFCFFTHFPGAQRPKGGSQLPKRKFNENSDTSVGF